VLVVTRFEVPEADSDEFLVLARTALAAFAARDGYLRGRIGRAADDPRAWVLTTEWAGVGAYRRSLSSYDVKVGAAPLLARGRNEPSAFELLVRDGDAHESDVRESDRASDH
jgi:quinol monooxygenase YgiN